MANAMHLIAVDEAFDNLGCFIQGMKEQNAFTDFDVVADGTISQIMKMMAQRLDQCGIAIDHVQQRRD